MLGGSNMQENKIQILFDQIHLDSDTRERLSSMLLEKVKVNEKNGSWTFVLTNPEILSLDDYKHLVELACHAFRNIKEVYIQIIPTVEDLTKLKDYYQYALEQCKDILLFASVFNDNLVSDELKIEVNNEEEEKQILQILPKLNYLLNLYGFHTPLQVVLNSEKENAIKDAITKDLEKATKEIPISTPTVSEEKPVYYNKGNPNSNSGNYHREKKEDNPNAIVGRTIHDKPMQIKNIVGEIDPITVEGYVFGVDYFESSKTDFKIITLKLTDYSDSIYCKVFCRGEDDFSVKKKALKDG